MHLPQLSKLLKFDVVAAAAGAGTSDVVTSAIDMQGYDSLLILVPNIAVANAGNYVSVAQCATSGGSYNDLAGSKTLTDASNNAVVVGITRPQKRYLKATIKRGSSSASSEVVAIRYNSRFFPQVNDVVNTMNENNLIEPAEGTA